MKAFWIDSSNLSELTGLKNNFTDALLTNATVTSITGQLYDDAGVAVGSAIAFTYDNTPGAWHATWTATMTEGEFYTLQVAIIAPGLTHKIEQILPARYKGPTD